MPFQYQYYPTNMIGTITYILSVFFLFIYDLRSINSSLPKDCGRTIFKIEYETARIIEGQEACLGEFPWMVRLGIKRDSTTKFICGGSLISTYYVVSVAHCERCNMARIGENYLDTDPDCDTGSCAPKHQDIKIQTFIPYPKYTGAGHKYDYGLVKLEKPAKLNDYVQPICFPNAPVPHADLKSELLFIAGWGIVNLTESIEYAKQLMYITAPLLNHDRCNAIYTNRLTDDQMCIGYDKGQDSCNGDSGGPVFRVISKDRDKRFHLVGLVSYGLRDCGKGPAVYTDVSRYVEWTLKTMKN